VIRQRLGTPAAIVATTGLLGVYDEVRRHMIPGEFHDLTNTSMIGVMVPAAWCTGLSVREVGLARGRTGWPRRQRGSRCVTERLDR